MSFGKGGEGGMMRPPGSRSEFGLRREADATIETGLQDESKVTEEQISNWNALVDEGKKMLKATETRTLLQVLYDLAQACTLASGPKIAMVKSSESVIREELEIINSYLEKNGVKINKLSELNLRDIPGTHWDGYQR